MVVVTMVRLGKVPFNSEQKGHRKMIGAWVALVVVQAAAVLWGRSDLYKNLAENSAEMLSLLGYSENYELCLCVGLGYANETPAAKPRDINKVKFVD